MSSDWETSAHTERIKNRKQKLDEKRQARAEANPYAFAWTEENGQYHCEVDGCDHDPFATLAGCLEHMHVHELDEGQTGLDQW